MSDLSSALHVIQQFLLDNNKKISAQLVWNSLEQIQLAVNEKFSENKTIRNDFFHSYFDHLHITFSTCLGLQNTISNANSLPATHRNVSNYLNDDENDESNIDDLGTKHSNNQNCSFKPRRMINGTYTSRNDNSTCNDRNYDLVNNFSNNYTQLGIYWDFDFLTHYKTVDLVKSMGPVVVFGFSLLKKTLSNFHPSCLQFILPLLVDIQKEYQENHYHNSLHGAMVAHLGVILSREIGVESLLSSYDQVAFILAALAHDVGHPANTANPLSLIYNDISTLENYHSSLLFHILRCHPEFVNQFGAKDWQNMRKRIVELILATDMRCHFNHVNEIKQRRLNGTFDLSNHDDMWKALVICIKAADIGHVAVSWDSHFQWTKLVAEEFYDQGDDERKLGLPISFLCDRNLADQLPLTQVNFLKCIAMPLMEELQYLETDGKFISNTVIANVNQNITNWTKNLAEEEAEKK